MPPGHGPRGVLARIREVLGDADGGWSVEFDEEVVGNASPAETPLMDAIRDWVAREDPERPVVPYDAPRLHGLARRSATPSPTAWPTASSRTAT